MATVTDSRLGEQLALQPRYRNCNGAFQHHQAYSQYQCCIIYTMGWPIFLLRPICNQLPSTPGVQAYETS